MNENDFWNRIDRYLAGEASPAERAEIEHWLAQSPDRAGMLETLRQQRSHAWDVDAAWHRVAGSMRRAAPAARAPASLAARMPASLAARVGTSFWLKAAAFAALLLGGVLTWRLTSSPAAEVTVAEVRTVAGQRDTVDLPDGSVVVLAPESRIETRFSDEARQVRLTGEAFFDVARETARPFRVETGTALTEVLGTEFNVRAHTDTSASVVVVREGRVSVRSRNTSDSIVLEAGQVGLASVSDAAVLDARAERWLAWLDGNLEFDNAPLTEVTGEIRRWFGVDVRLAGPELRERRVTGRFTAGSVEEVLRALELALGIVARQDSAGWSLQAR